VKGRSEQIYANQPAVETFHCADMKFPITIFSLVLLLLSPLQGGDWLQFRGPNASGLSPESVPSTWSETENLLWKVALPGPGVHRRSWWARPFSSPATLVKGRRWSGISCGWIATPVPWFGKIDSGLESRRSAQGYITEHGWASNTPVSDGKRIYLLFRQSWGPRIRSRWQPGLESGDRFHVFQDGLGIGGQSDSTGR